MASARWQRPNTRDTALATVNSAISDLNLAKETVSVTPAKAVFDSVSVLLTRIRVGIPLVYVGRLHANVHRDQR